jgi:hypothetical protein
MLTLVKIIAPVSSPVLSPASPINIAPKKLKYISNSSNTRYAQKIALYILCFVVLVIIVSAFRPNITQKQVRSYT